MPACMPRAPRAPHRRTTAPRLAVRPMPSGRTCTEAPLPSVRWSRGSPCVDYKGRSPRPRVPDRRPPLLAPPPLSRVPTDFRGRATVLGPPRPSTVVDCAANSRAPAGGSPEPGMPRPAAAAAVAQLRQDPHRPGLRTKPVPSNPSTEPRPSPTVPAAGPRRNLAGAAPAGPEDQIAKIPVFLRANSQSKGISVRI
jgi:hypothetical protein